MSSGLYDVYPSKMDVVTLIATSTIVFHTFVIYACSIENVLASLITRMV